MDCLSNLTLRQLRYFVALAREGHFGRAAESCAVSQPALSVQIKELEETLGCQLFERMPRKLRLTVLGRELLARAQDILRAVDELGDLTRAAQEHWVGQLRIGVIPTIAPYVLPQVVNRLMQEFPDMDLRIRETMTSTLLDELAQGQIDCALLALPISEPNLQEMPLFDEAFVLVRPWGDHHKPVPNPERLREMRLLLLEEGHCFRDQALEICQMTPGGPRETLDGTTLSTLVQMVGAGMGVTLLPEMAIPIETGQAAVSIARFQTPQPSRSVGLIWRRSSPLRDQFERIGQMIRAVSQLDAPSAPHL
jgi:LysR family hydrogen peroxide-inducible transcriptional activator